MPLPKRKPTRLKNYDYSSTGAYFITICTKDRKEILSEITVGDDAHIVPKNTLSSYGLICDKYIKNISEIYESIKIDKYVIMPNHIHMIISIYGTMWASSPTNAGLSANFGLKDVAPQVKASSPTKNIEDIIRSFKILVSKEIGFSIWQRSFHDHVIRNKEDYTKIYEYIDNNVLNWSYDCFYNEKRTQ